MKAKMSLIGFMCIFGCTVSGPENSIQPSTEKEMGGSRVFKIPVPRGYDWEVTQSWKEHCSSCNAKGYNWDYCSSLMSHTWSCCKYAWDFNLPLNTDDGKPVLASFDGVIEDLGLNDGWGNYVVINHGHNICTRYAHMQNGSSSHLYRGMEVCQGLVVGKIGNTGASEGHHLHFHFEYCDNPDISIKKAFTDGNDVPMCTRGNDVYDSNGKYNFLKLTNEARYSCADDSVDVGANSSGWNYGGCGHIPSCPLNNACGRGFHHQFSDYGSLSGLEAMSAAYLYGECALDGKIDGKIHADDMITRAESLKISLVLFDLLESCGDQSYFADVEESDWYFDVVACAVKKKIVTNISTYFRPDAFISRDEAISYLVSSANYYGLAEKEAITALYNYPGSKNLTREDFFVMASSLSPCFCPNVVCSDGCFCDQENFTCLDPSSSGNEYGGNQEEDLDTEDVKSLKNYDLTVNCDICPEKNRCVEENTVLYIKCSAENDGDALYVDDLILYLSDPNDMKSCVVVDDSLHKGVGYFEIEAGEEMVLPGHFEIECDAAVIDSLLELTFDLVEKDNKESVLHTSFVENVVGVNSGYFEPCTEDTLLSQWGCSENYVVSLYSPGGSFEILASGSTPNYSAVIPEGMHMKMTFDCIDLPASILFQGGPEGLSVIPESDELVMLDIWAPYHGALTLQPQYTPDISANSFASVSPNMTILVRVPK